MASDSALGQKLKGNSTGNGTNNGKGTGKKEQNATLRQRASARVGTFRKMASDSALGQKLKRTASNSALVRGARGAADLVKVINAQRQIAKQQSNQRLKSYGSAPNLSQPRRTTTPATTTPNIFRYPLPTIYNARQRLRSQFRRSNSGLPAAASTTPAIPPAIPPATPPGHKPYNFRRTLSAPARIFFNPVTKIANNATNNVKNALFKRATGAATEAAARLVARKLPPQYAAQAAKAAKGAAAAAAAAAAGKNTYLQNLGVNITEAQGRRAADFATELAKNLEAAGAKNPKPPGGNQTGGYKSNNIFRYYDKFNQPNIYKFN